MYQIDTQKLSYPIPSIRNSAPSKLAVSKIRHDYFCSSQIQNDKSIAFGANFFGKLFNKSQNKLFLVSVENIPKYANELTEKLLELPELAQVPPNKKEILKQIEVIQSTINEMLNIFCPEATPKLKVHSLLELPKKYHNMGGLCKIEPHKHNSITHLYFSPESTRCEKLDKILHEFTHFLQENTKEMRDRNIGLVNKGYNRGAISNIFVDINLRVLFNRYSLNDELDVALYEAKSIGKTIRPKLILPILFNKISLKELQETLLQEFLIISKYEIQAHKQGNFALSKINTSDKIDLIDIETSGISNQGMISYYNTVSEHIDRRLHEVEDALRRKDHFTFDIFDQPDNSLGIPNN